MTIEALQIIAIAAAVLSLIALGAAIYGLRMRRGPGTASRQKMEDEIAAVRAELESTRERSRLLEERFDRYERTQTDFRDAHDRLREDVEARLTRVQSHDSAQKALQEQIYEIRKEHQVLMERGDRHDRRMSELQEQVSALRTDLTTVRGDGKKSRV